ATSCWLLATSCWLLAIGYWLKIEWENVDIKMRDFRKYEVWHLAISVTRKIYSKTRDLPIAIGSSFEVENLPELIYKLRYIKTEKLQEVLTELNLLQRKLNNCIQILSGRFYSILFLNA